MAGVPDLQARVNSHEDIKIGLLEDRVSSLTSSLDAYKLLRNRFISTFKRDNLGNATDGDRKIIEAVNAWVHGGDAVVDASLYTGPDQRRRDPSVYEGLYGLDPLRVLSINHKQTIDVLNIHAGVIISKQKTGSKVFYTKFGEFISLFKKSDYDESYLDGGGVADAYWEFLRCAKDEVRDIVEHESGK